MLAEQTTEPPLDQLRPVASRVDVAAAIVAVRDVYVEESVNRYAVALLRHTRDDERLALGASPRSGISLMRLAKARAVVERRDYVIPEDVRAVAPAVLPHRVLLAPEALSSGLTPEQAVADALAGTPVPV